MNERKRGVNVKQPNIMEEDERGKGLFEAIDGKDCVLLYCEDLEGLNDFLHSLDTTHLGYAINYLKDGHKGVGGHLVCIMKTTFKDEELLLLSKRLGERFGQEYILLKDKDNKGNILYTDRNKGEAKALGELNENALETFFNMVGISEVEVLEQVTYDKEEKRCHRYCISSTLLNSMKKYENWEEFWDSIHEPIRVGADKYV